MLGACANISLGDLESSGTESYINMRDDSFGSPVDTSTLLKALNNENVVAQSPPPTVFSPWRGISSSSKLSDDDNLEQQDDSIPQPQDELNLQLQAPELTQLQSKDAESDSHKQQPWSGFKIVGDNVIRP